MIGLDDLLGNVGFFDFIWQRSEFGIDTVGYVATTTDFLDTGVVRVSL